MRLFTKTNLLIISFYLVGCASDNYHAVSKTVDADLIEANNTVKASDPTLTTHLQEELSIGLVKVSIHNFCTPMLDICESWVVLNYGVQAIKKLIPWMRSQKLSKDDISQNGKFIAINSTVGGNCVSCDGINVFKLEDERLISLGYFNEIEGEFLVGLYDVLQNNGLVPRAGSPFWPIYYKDVGSQIILDLEKTCNFSSYRHDYDMRKELLIKDLSRPNNKIKKTNDDTDNLTIYASMLSVLSFSRWCGLENDYLTLVSIINKSRLLDFDKLNILNKELNQVKKGDDTETLNRIRDR